MKVRISQLDGLRGIAIMIVLLGHLLTFHWGLDLTRLGAIAPAGVDLFFVLSGFLITGILFGVKDETGYFKNFYARRALRTWPLYFLLLLFLWGFAKSHIGVLAVPSDLHWQVYACYAQNLVYYQVGRVTLLPLAVTWSLAVEEQFYLVWPVLVWLVPKKNLWMYLVPLIIIAPVARVILPHYGIDPYYNSICRFDAMAMGALLAAWISIRTPNAGEIRRTATVILSVAVVGGIVGYSIGLIHILISSLISGIYAAILALSLESRWLIRLLDLSVLRYTGKISYCLYLCHAIVGYLIFALYPGGALNIELLRAALVLTLSYAIATVSWYSFESQLLRLKQFFKSRGPRQVNGISRMRSSLSITTSQRG